MLDAADKGSGEGIRISNPGGSGPAPMRRSVRPEAVYAQVPLFRIQLRGILTVSDAPSVRLFAYPAFVADVGVAAGGVHRRDDAPRFRARAIGHGEPRARGTILIDVLGRRFNAHIRQSGPLEVESSELFAVHLEWARIPVAFSSLPSLGGGFAPSVRVVKDLASRRFLHLFGLGSLTRRVRSINNTRICFQAVARSHNGNYAIIP